MTNTLNPYSQLLMLVVTFISAGGLWGGGGWSRKKRLMRMERGSMIRGRVRVDDRFTVGMTGKNLVKGKCCTDWKVNE